MLIDQIKTVQVNAKTICIDLEVKDNFCCVIKDSDGSELCNFEGYVPDFMPENHYGDCVVLDIDMDTGQILNWKIPNAKTIEEFIKNANENKT